MYVFFSFLLQQQQQKCFGFRSQDKKMNPNRLQLLVSDVWALVWNKIYIAHALQKHTLTHTILFIWSGWQNKTTFAVFQWQDHIKIADQSNNKNKGKCLQNWVTANSWWQCKRERKKQQHDTNHFFRIQNFMCV